MCRHTALGGVEDCRSNSYKIVPECEHIPDTTRGFEGHLLFRRCKREFVPIGKKFLIREFVPLRKCVRTAYFEHSIV